MMLNRLTITEPNYDGFELNFRSRFVKPAKVVTRADLERTIDKIPPDLMKEMGAKLYLLINLTWGYAETICDILKQNKVQDTKVIVRQIRALKRQYDQFRQSSMGDKETALETEMGEWFEEEFTADFDRLFADIDLQSAREYKDSDERIFAVAVQQCLTLIEAVKKYGLWCDEQIRKYGILMCNLCMVQSEFLLLHDVIKYFEPSIRYSFKTLREISSNIIVNRLLSLKVGTENGKIVITKKQ